jgi:hypothetical protein
MIAVSAGPSRSQFKDALHEPDHLSMIFATDLERRPGFKRAAVATGENRALEFGRGGAEPALGRNDAQPLIQIH